MNIVFTVIFIMIMRVVSVIVMTLMMFNENS